MLINKKLDQNIHPPSFGSHTCLHCLLASIFTCTCRLRT